jgi:hypothetical protein
MPTEACMIKVADTDPSKNMRANEMAIEAAKNQ